VGLAKRRAGKTYAEFCEELRRDPQTATWYVEKGIANGGRELHRIWQKAGADIGKVAGSPLVIDPKAPHDIARAFLAAHFVEGGQRTLHCHRGAFYAWNGTAYPEADDASLRAKIYDFLDQCVTVIHGDAAGQAECPNSRQRARRPRRTGAARRRDRRPRFARPHAQCSRRGDLLLRQRALTPADPRIAAAHAGVVHPQRGRLRLRPQRDSATPLARLPRRPLARRPRSRRHVAGDLPVTADMSQQKGFLLVGPKRSGKGTIARVLTRLVGIDNTVAPTLAGLGVNFGLAPLIGKRIAIISDARLGGRADQHAIAERLLSITGEDAITIDRKFREAWTGDCRSGF